MRLQRVFNVTIQLLVAARSLGGVQIASADNVTVRSIEVQRAGDIVEIAKGKELDRVSFLMFLEVDAQRSQKRLSRSSARSIEVSDCDVPSF